MTRNNLPFSDIESRRRLYRLAYILCLVLACVHLAVQLFVWLPGHWQRKDMDRDITYSYLAMERLSSGKQLYPPADDRRWGFLVGGPSVGTWYMYQPVCAAALLPFSGLSYVNFARLWYVMLLISFWIFAVTLVRLAGLKNTLPRVLIAGLAIFFMPGSYRALSLGQIDVLLWAMLGLAFLTRARGAILAASCFFKPFAAWPLLAAWIREGRRVIIQAAVVAFAGIVIGGAVCGWSVYADWARLVLPIAGQGTFNPDNVSISFAGLRLARLMGWHYTYGPLPAAARIYLGLTGVLAPAAVMWLTRRLKPAEQYSLVAGAGILFSPYCWSTYLPMLLIAASLGVSRSRPYLLRTFGAGKERAQS